MNKSQHSAGGPADTLRAQLQWGLDVTGADAGSEALQDRVMAQWQQRHPATEAALATAGGAAHPADSVLRRRLLWGAASAALLVAALLSVAPWQRPDPALDELMQLDVLSVMSIGAM